MAIKLPLSPDDVRSFPVIAASLYGPLGKAMERLQGAAEKLEGARKCHGNGDPDADALYINAVVDTFAAADEVARLAGTMERNVRMFMGFLDTDVVKKAPGVHVLYIGTKIQEEFKRNTDVIFAYLQQQVLAVFGVPVDEQNRMREKIESRVKGSVQSLMDAVRQPVTQWTSERGSA